MEKPDANDLESVKDRKSTFQATEFGRYYLVDQISKGGMSGIFLAKSVGLGGFQKPVVIKKLLPDYSRKSRYVRRFLTEAKTLAQLNHSNVVQVVDMGVVEGEYYIATEYIEGRNVAHILSKANKQQRLPSLEFCLYVVLELGKGLAYSHRKKGAGGEHLMLVHQDVNSFNVMVSYEAEVKIVDFGIARIMLDRTTWEGVPVAGKLIYFCPEQLLGKEVDRRVDIYGTGVLLYELITGERLVHHQKTVNDTVKSILDMDVKEKIRNHQRIPDELKPILERATAHDPEDRYPWMEELMSDIRKLAASAGLDLDPIKFSTYMKSLFRDEMLLDRRRMRRLLAAGAMQEDDLVTRTAPLELDTSDAESTLLEELLALTPPETAERKESKDSKESEADPEQGIRTVTLPANTQVFDQGEEGNELYVVREGRVRLYVRAGKSEQTVGMVTEGGFLGEGVLLNEKRRFVAAQTLEETTLICFDASVFEQVVPRGLGRSMILELVERLRDTCSMLMSALFEEPLARLISGLLFFYRQHPAPANGREIDLGELRELFRLRNSSLVEKYLTKLETLEIIEARESVVYIKNPEKLENILSLLAGKGKLSLRL